MNSNTKTLLFTILLLGTVLTLFTATTVMASTSNVLSGQHQCDQDREQLNKNNNSSLDDGHCERHQYQHSSDCSDCDKIPVMNQMQHRYQHRHCWNQDN